MRGQRTDLVTTMRLALWAAQSRPPPTVHDVQGYLQCSRQKALEWHRALLKALTTARDIPTGGNRTQPRTPHDTRS